MWFLTNLARLDKERAAIADLQGNVDWLKLAKWGLVKTKLRIDLKIEVDGVCHRLYLSYPACYPANPPTVYPAKKARLSSVHQYGDGGELCLEWGPDNWCEDLTAADMVCSAFKLLSLEVANGTAPGEVDDVVIPSRHKLELGQEIRRSSLRFLVHNEFIETHSNEIGCGDVLLADFDYILPKGSSCVTIALTALRVPGAEEPSRDNAIPSGFSIEAINKKGLFVKTELPNQFFSKGSPSVVVDTAVDASSVAMLEDDWTSILFLSDSNGKFLYHRYGKDGEWYRADNICIEPGIHGRLAEHYADLERKKVGIVGLGSAGSKIALSLCRSGVKHFLLVDHDVFLPENICRHVLDWEDVGQHKVEAVSRKLKLLQEDVTVETRKIKLSGQEATASVDNVLSKLGQCDLIVDATADAVTFNQLSSVATQCSKPFLWLEVFPGGFGGYIARSRPGLDPLPKQIRAELNIYMDEHAFPEINSSAEYCVVTSDGTVMVADDADVTIVSAHLTKMAIDLLLANEPSIYRYSLYFLGMGNEWIFDQALQAFPYDLNAVQQSCDTEKLSEDQMKENAEFLSDLIAASIPE